MRIRKYRTIHQLTFLPSVFPINCYLMEEIDGLTLIDTGMGFCGKGILKEAEKMGKPISRIALTHLHSDHSSSLDYISEAIPTAEVFMSKREYKLLSSDFSLNEGEPQVEVKGSYPKNIKTKPDVLLKDGDTVGSLQVISAPGHTPGSIAFYDERTKTLIAGDAMQGRGGLAVAGDKRPLFPFIAIATWSLSEAIKSAKRFCDLDIGLLAVGHGDMLQSPKKSMIAAIARAEKIVGGAQNG